MKALLKGLRYISRMFEHEKEPEMKIGLPTDVQHVAHIGQDGPSAVNNAPTWMNEFKAQAGSQGGEVGENEPVKCASQDGRSMSRKSSRGKNSSSRDKPELPKSSTNGTKEKPDKAKQSKKTRKQKDPNQETESTSKDTKKNSKKKKMKESSGEGSSRRCRTEQDLDTVSESGSQFSCASEL